MEEESPSSSKDSQESTKERSITAESTISKWQGDQSQRGGQTPPSFFPPHSNGRTPPWWWLPICLLATIRIPISENPDDPVSTMFEHLETFMTHMLEADAHFMVFPHNLSEYKSLEDLPKPLEDPDQIHREVNNWLECFPGATWGGYTYTSALLGFWEPFPKVIKATVLWLCKSTFRLWKSSLQSESCWDGYLSWHEQWT